MTDTGVMSDPWFPGQIAKDLASIGVADTRIVFKADTENSIVEVWRAVAIARGNVPMGCDESRVGDPNSNSKIEAPSET